MNNFKKTAIAMGVAQIALMASGAVLAQSAASSKSDTAGVASADVPQTVVVTGQRRALENAQTIKQNAEEVIDSIVADEAGKLPDRSIAEVLQRVPGVMIDRVFNKADPQHFGVEGSGVTVRGLSYVRSELNGRDAFQSNGGRALSWSDVPPELMAGVDVYKNPSAEQIEGAVSGLVNLRTAMPFDYKGLHGAVSLKATRGKLRGETAPDGSMLISNRWDTGFGKVGALLDLAHSGNKTRSDAIQSAPYFPRFDLVPGKEVYVPQNGSWRREDYDHSRDGMYGALQWKNNAFESSLSYFQSNHKSKWSEAAQWSPNDAYKTQFENATYDDNGAFLSGKLSNPADGGVKLVNNRKVMRQETQTKDLSWNLVWKASESWTLKSDLQFVRAKSESKMRSVELNTLLPSLFLDVSGATPKIDFDDAARAAMADLSNSSWYTTQEFRDQNKAKQTSWRGDAKYTFDDPVLRDVRFGVRYTDRQADNRATPYFWTPIVAPWAAGPNSWNSASTVAKLSDPRFNQFIEPVTFNNFFNGKSTVPPALLVPSPSSLDGDQAMATFATLHGFSKEVCNPWGNGCVNMDGYTPVTAETFNSPENNNKQSEQTTAGYTTLRFGFDDWRFPVEGNVGVRVVQTRMTAHGYMKFTPATGTLPAGVPKMTAVAEPRDYAQTYVNVLPSLNLKLSASRELQFRFAYSQGVSRPDFSQLQAYESLSQGVVTEGGTDTTPATLKELKYTGTNKGNPLLKPTRGTSFDLTAEWYPASATSVTLAVFNKKLKDIVISRNYVTSLKDDAGTDHNFVVSGPVNGAGGTVRGMELGFQNYFDKLPGLLSGFGVSGNYTYVDSKYELYDRLNGKWCSGLSQTDAANFDGRLNGCDTNGQAIGELPMPYLSKNAFNLALMYDKGPISARVAYSWRGRYLQAVNANGYTGGNGTNTNPDSPTYKQTNVAYNLPVWAEAYGTVDAGISYKFDDHLSLSLEGQNLTNAVFKQTIQQYVGQHGIMWFATGPRYTASMRYQF